jgi:hypothetical protein
MLKPIIQENRNGFNDIINLYNPNKHLHTLGEYAQVANQTPNENKNTKQSMV